METFYKILYSYKCHIINLKKDHRCTQIDITVRNNNIVISTTEIATHNLKSIYFKTYTIVQFKDEFGIDLRESNIGDQIAHIRNHYTE